MVIEIGAFLDHREGRFSYDTLVGWLSGDPKPERWTREIEATYLVANPLSVRANLPVWSSQSYLKAAALIGFLLSATSRLERVGDGYHYSSDWDVSQYAEDVDRAVMVSAGVDFQIVNRLTFAELAFLWGFDTIKGDMGVADASDSGLGGAKYRTLMFEVGLRF